jgi:hypothetical protein
LIEGHVNGCLARVEEEEVDPEGPGRPASNGGDVRRDLLCRSAADTEGAQPAGVADGRDEGHRGVTGHAAKRDRVPNSQQIAEGCMDQGILHSYRPRFTSIVPATGSYPGHFLVKRVTNAGTIRLKTQLLCLANALQQHPPRPTRTLSGRRASKASRRAVGA